MVKIMEQQKYETKANEILTWLNANDAGALGPVIEATLQAGMTATSDEDRDKFWASVRALCGTLPKSPIRRGIQSSLSAEQSANVDSVTTRIENAFASIGEADLILDVMHPRQRGDSIGPYDSIESWAADMASSINRKLKMALKEDRWDGSLNGDNLTGMALPAPKAEKSEAPSEE
tara:strand:- start:23 stop:550 length:528 start_codon:yes stop_codon:yes gene_type:complete